ncbi:hypothetical protein M436DRAFT_49208 [Aureobasidium namibiae CBS 147.97]|uniref:PAC domain-containing protein n=1 Tax=Aureobasidium namibiae CBS 147.97 TaxID=1043004 RepID=A0A074WRD9_9PEZI|nr:uncharacterized protein M436DRAFT_49208 [Aureobasidium namibiae CBS 147.97]KEQ72272.1 hypothetical protein M436DRAFT_49208 [Aureobasidium namibiae CBS 147.97]
MEHLAMRFFSVDHLNIILRDYQSSARFHRFLTQYRPYTLPSLESYVDTQKAVAAIEYANSLADNLPSLTGDIPRPAAVMEKRFEERSRLVVQELVDDALPAYLTHRLVTIVTDSLVKEITGNIAPILRDLIPSLAEVYCISDPSLPDNPIVYASEAFYDISGYQKDFVIGRNCRFLQGPKSSSASVHRLIEALRAGQEITETLLNYRRDGIPFMNLLLIAPLYDNKGSVRYFLGAQVDVSHLIEGGKGIESFEKLLANDRAEERYRGRSNRKPTQVLGELGQMMNDDELDAINTRQRSQSRSSTPATSSRNPIPIRHGRKVFGMDDSSEHGLWPHPSLGPSGRLPGVYQNYLLVRPYPSLRITFTSPALRIPGLLQTKFMERLGGPQEVRDGVLDSLSHGTPVTAKVSWLSTPSQPGSPHRNSIEGKPRWIHCTPMLGSDEKVGVWMVVMVEQEVVTGNLTRPTEVINTFPSPPPNVIGRSSLDTPVRGGEGARSPRFKAETGKLYAEYLRREGRNDMSHGGIADERSGSPREARPFQDF